MRTMIPKRRVFAMAVPRTLEELNQHPVFSYFLWLCEIPHATFKEKALSNAIYTWAKRHEKWMSWQDTHHNLYIRKPATPGYEANRPCSFKPIWTWSAWPHRTLSITR